MRFRLSAGKLSLGFTAAALLAAGAAWALPAPPPNSSAMSPAAWLAGGTARLDHALNAENAKPGETIEAKLDRTVKTPDGTELPGGTQLRGTVTAVNASSNGPSRISIRFDKAVLKDGKTLPVKVAVIGAYPSDENQMSLDGDASMGPVQKHVSLKDRFDQEAGTLHDVAMHSRVSGQNSATFINKNGNVKLRAGTFLQVGIGQRSNTNGNMASGA